MRCAKADPIFTSLPLEGRFSPKRGMALAARPEEPRTPHVRRDTTGRPLWPRFAGQKFFHRLGKGPVWMRVIGRHDIVRPELLDDLQRRPLCWRETDSNLYGAFPVKLYFWFVAGSLFGAGKPFFVPSPAIRFAERAEGVKGPKR